MAKALGSHRNPNNGGAQADIDTDLWAIEHKLRKTIPQWIWGAMAQAVSAAESNEAHQRPLVILTQSSRGRKVQRLVVMRFEDFVEVI